ncbi:hypothetical protein [Marinobacter adhaerens]|uniref:ABC transporter related protein n=1 Tax=Marinobacter adhaerens (strain DSM 23420 / HP15) TaxID=225937 RepID=E4PFI1_MARAH|nr:hypothetical protein [Marinobacter adhaerens]ADP96730.1 ABC transporter related protein [Marinobacter adhaerens HP15]
MSNIIENLSYVLPVFITAVMVIFLWFRRKTEVEFREISRSISYLDDEKDNKNSNIEKLVTRGDVELRVLEEITDASSRHYFLVEGNRQEKLSLSVSKMI